jgi:dienelactone hydrolase
MQRLMFVALAALASAESRAQEMVRVPINDGTDIEARLYRPDGPGPHPAIVALHGCGGLFTQAGAVTTKNDDWGRRLAGQGYIVLFPDSFRSRGLGSQCVVKDRVISPQKERVADAKAGLRFLQERLDVQPDAVALLGWSNGATAALWAAGIEKRPANAKPDFTAVVAISPGCRLTAQAAERREWGTRLPILVLIGDADTWTPAQPCRQLVDATRDGAVPVDVIAYPGALHDFDHPGRQQVRRTGLAYTPDNSGEAMVGTDPAARADALVRVPQFFARFMRGAVLGQNHTR